MAVMRIEDPLLADRVADAEHRSAKHLSTERVGMHDRAFVGVGEEIDDVVLAGFDVDFDFREARDVGEGLRHRADSVAWRRRPVPVLRARPPKPWSFVEVVG